MQCVFIYYSKIIIRRQEAERPDSGLLKTMLISTFETYQEFWFCHKRFPNRC